MATSRYFNNRIYQNHYLTFKRIPREIVDAIPAYEYKVKYGERLDHIAFKAFGDGTLWWVIAIMNNIGFEFSEMDPSDVIKVPFSVDDVYGLLK